MGELCIFVWDPISGGIGRWQCETYPLLDHKMYNTAYQLSTVSVCAV